MENKESLNKKNVPINVIEQKEIKNMYRSKKGVIEKQDKKETGKFYNEKEEKEEEGNIQETLKEEETLNINNSDNNNDIQLKSIDTFIKEDNKLTNELKIKFNDIIKHEFEFHDKLPLIRNGSYLTELPSDIYNTKKKNITFKKNNYKESSKVIKYLKEKELSLNKEIADVKDKKGKLMNISYSNLGLSDIEKNKNNYERKKLQTIENNLMDKLNEVKFQIKGILQREKLLKNSKSTLIQNFIKRYENDEDISDFKKYMRINKKLVKVNRKEEKKEELNNIEIEKKKEDKKDDKRMEQIKEEVSKLEKNPVEKNYLFFKMANSFEEKEKLFYMNKKPVRKSEVLGKEELKKLYQNYKEKQKELKEKANEKTIEMKKEWHTNSLVLQKYKTPLKNIFNIKELEEKERLKEEEKINKKKKNYENKNNIIVPLPKISTKLRRENLKLNFNINDLQGKERVKYIKEEVDQIKKYIHNYYDIKNKRFKQSNILNKHKTEIKIDYRLQSKTINKIENIENKKRKVNVVENYLEDSKRNSNKNMDWEKYLYDEDNIVTNIKNIKGQIEGLDNNAEMKKEILRINGGFLNNQKLGSELSNILINSINGKISIIKAMNN